MGFCWECRSRRHRDLAPRLGRCRRYVVPATRGRLEIDRLVGLALGSEALRGELRRRQRLLVEPRRNLIALLGSVAVAVCGGQREPPIGFRQIGLNADAAGEKDGQIVLAVGDAVTGGLAEPFRRRLVVRLAVDALGVEHREIVHSLGVPLAGGSEVKPAGRLYVLLQALALFVEAGEPELGGCEAGFGSALEPANRLGRALLNPASFGVTGAQL